MSKKCTNQEVEKSDVSRREFLKTTAQGVASLMGMSNSTKTALLDFSYNPLANAQDDSFLYLQDEFNVIEMEWKNRIKNLAPGELCHLWEHHQKDMFIHEWIMHELRRRELFSEVDIIPMEYRDKYETYCAAAREMCNAFDQGKNSLGDKWWTKCEDIYKELTDNIPQLMTHIEPDWNLILERYKAQHPDIEQIDDFDETKQKREVIGNILGGMLAQGKRIMQVLASRESEEHMRMTQITQQQLHAPSDRQAT